LKVVVYDDSHIHPWKVIKKIFSPRSSRGMANSRTPCCYLIVARLIGICVAAALASHVIVSEMLPVAASGDR
jgi:hypothetical protein